MHFLLLRCGLDRPDTRRSDVETKQIDENLSPHQPNALLPTVSLSYARRSCSQDHNDVIFRETIFWPFCMSTCRVLHWDVRIGRLLAAQAGESTGVVRVDGGRAATSTTGTATGEAITTARGTATRESVTTARGTSTGSTAGSTTATVATLSSAATVTTTASATATAAVTGAVGRLLLPLVLSDENVLRLALALALLLASRRSDEVLIVFLDEGLGASPLLLLLGVDTLVGLASRCAGVQGSLLLGLLGEVSLEKDLLGLRLLGLGLGILSLSILLLGLSNGLTGLLVVELGSSLGGAP